MTENPQTCPKCGSPVAPGMKFCESCGAKIEARPACAKCGAVLEPGIRFCESCGAPVSPAAPAAATETKPVPDKVQAAEPPAAVKPEERPAAPAATVKEPAPVAETSPAAAPAVTQQPKSTPAPAEKPPAAAPAKEAANMVKAGVTPKESGPKQPIPQKTLIIAGIVILAIIGAAVYFVGLPMLSGNGSAPAVPSAPALPGSPLATAAPAAGSPAESPSAGSAAGPASFAVEATKVPPANLLVTFQADRDPITGNVLITFTGGAGRYGVRDVDIRLTRSDGQVITRTVTIAEIGDGMTLQGTKTGDDRIELTANYNNGEQYKIIDKILVYTRRNW